MELNDLLQAYKYNNINVQLTKEFEEKKESSGVIKFTEDINASYMLDEEDIVIAMNIFCNCLTAKEKTIANQFTHSTNIIRVIQQTIILLANVTQNEANDILTELGMLNKKFLKEKCTIRYNEYIFQLSVISGLLHFSFLEKDTPG